MAHDVCTGEELIPEVQTGEPLAYVGGPCNTPPDPCVKFDVNSTSEVSAVFTVDSPMELLAFDLCGCDYVELEQVFGPNEGSHFEAVVLDGASFRLDKCNNRLLVPFAGRFRLRYCGEVGHATVVCNPTDCCFASLTPKGNAMSSCDPLTNTKIAEMLAFRKCDGGQVLPGESLAVCSDIAALDARIDGLNLTGTYVLEDQSGAPIPAGGCVVSCSDLAAELAVIDAGFAHELTFSSGTLQLLSGSGAVLSTISLPTAAAAATQIDFNTGTNVLSILAPDNSVLDSVSLASLAGGGGGGADGVVTNVQLTGSDLVFSGTGGGFNGSVDLSSLTGSGADGNISNIQLTGTDLVVTGSGGGFNGSVDLSSLTGLGGPPSGPAGGALTGAYPNPGLSPAAVATALGFDDCDGNPVAAGAAIATCANLAASLASVLGGTADVSIPGFQLFTLTIGGVDYFFELGTGFAAQNSSGVTNFQMPFTNTPWFLASGGAPAPSHEGSVQNVGIPSTTQGNWTNSATADITYHYVAVGY